MTSSTKLLWDDPKFSKLSTSIDNVTQIFGQRMLEQAGVDELQDNAPLVVFDNACGTGVVAAALHDMKNDRPQNTFEVLCGDLADARVAGTTERVALNGWANTVVKKIDSQDTGLPDNYFTHVFTNFGPMLFPKPEQMLSECNRILRPDGVCAFTTWAKVGWYDDLNAAMRSMPELPQLASLQDMTKAVGNGGDWHDPEYIRKMLSGHGFGAIKTQEMSNITHAADAAELETVLDIVIGIITSNSWTQEERDRSGGPALKEKIMKWFMNKYNTQPIEWHWIALVTTCVRN